MFKKLNKLDQQHGALRERIAQQRLTLAHAAAPLSAACNTVDRARARFNQFVRQASDLVDRHPAVIAGVVAAFVAIRPRRILRWSGRLIFAWRSWHSLRKF